MVPMWRVRSVTDYAVHVPVLLGFGMFCRVFFLGFVAVLRMCYDAVRNV